ncbi:zinc finger protein 862-like [Ostrea edulis]|uniref:zinc finger protein 862-like n=1 Tax=Ostrea edulis TaxID=37623 RepID=UPI0024AF3746|nr:zinc finger protein 862-like [Ostrea edulis]
MCEVEATRGSPNETFVWFPGSLTTTHSRQGTREPRESMASWPIKFTPGSKPGQASKRKRDVDNSKLKYEKQRKREFKEDWKEGREWLQFDGEKMTCNLCQVHGMGECRNVQNFVTGSVNFRYSGIIDHENSRFHRQAVERFYAKENVRENKQSEAHKAIVSMDQSIRQSLETKFRNIHALVKYNRPISDFTWLNALDQRKGLEHGTTYNNRWAATAFLECISETVKSEVVGTVQNSQFFSITMDGSTDSGTIEQETLFIRCCVHGKIELKFLCIGEPRSTCALDLLEFVKEKIEENKLADQMHKLVGFGCDGASNMLGRHNGLVSLLKRDYVEMLGVHCLAHRLELAHKDALKDDRQYVQLSTLLLGLYYFYKNSAKQRKNLRDCMKVRYM